MNRRRRRRIDRDADVVLQPQAKKDRDLDSAEAPRRLLNFRLDWRAYFRRFCREHGGNPIDLGDVICLPDGWTYSRSRHEGPEWPPPPEPRLTALLVRYWETRLGIVSQELTYLEHARLGLRDAMVQRSAPLMRKRRVKDEATDKWSWSLEEVSLDAMDHRLAWLRGDAEYCEEELKRLNQGAEHAIS